MREARIRGKRGGKKKRYREMTYILWVWGEGGRPGWESGKNKGFRVG